MIGEPPTLDIEFSERRPARAMAAPAPDYALSSAAPDNLRILHPRRWWYLAPANGCPPGTAAEGPWALAQVQAAMQAGAVESTRLVWTPGMASWEPAGYQTEFAFEFSPPPLPAA
jgi:hypothetical protein